MTPEKQREIAEWCGVRRHEMADHLDSKLEYQAQKNLLKYFDRTEHVTIFRQSTEEDVQVTNADKAREIAEWCGWTDIQPNMAGFLGCNPEGEQQQLPRYHDLNACAEFEAVVAEGIRADWYEYVVALRRVLGRDKGYDWCLSLNPQTIEPLRMLDVLHIVWLAMHATPEQRCEAILAVIRETKA